MSLHNDNGHPINDFKVFGNTRVLATSAILTAVSVTLAFIAKSVFPTGVVRLTIENLPIFLASFLFGPAVGGAVAVCTDLLSCFLFAMPPIPLVTVGAFTLGCLSGILYKYAFKKLKQKSRIILSVFISHTVGSMTVKSIALYDFYRSQEISVLFRIPLYLSIATVEAMILSLLFENRNFMAQVEKVLKKK